LDVDDVLGRKTKHRRRADVVDADGDVAECVAQKFLNGGELGWPTSVVWADDDAGGGGHSDESGTCLPQGRLLHTTRQHEFGESARSRPRKSILGFARSSQHLDDSKVLMTVRFSNQLVAEMVQPFWAAVQRGEFLTDAAAVAGTNRWRGLQWVREAGGVRPRRGRDLKGRCLSFAEREEIAVGRAGEESMRSIAARLRRSPSTISRELARNHSPGGGYRASSAHVLA